MRRSTPRATASWTYPLPRASSSRCLRRSRRTPATWCPGSTPPRWTRPTSTPAPRARTRALAGATPSRAAAGSIAWHRASRCSSTSPRRTGRRRISKSAFGFQTTRIEPLPDVSLSTPPSPSGDTFTSAAGAYLSSDLKGCTGEWSVYVEPPEPVGAEQLTSPFTSAPGSWRLVRTIGMPQAQFCGAFASRGAASCQDTFLVDINLRGDP